MDITDSVVREAVQSSGKRIASASNQATSARRLAAKSSEEIEEAKADIEEALKESSGRLDQLETASEFASTLSVGSALSKAGIEAPRVENEDLSVSEAIESGAKDVADSVSSSLVSTIEAAIAPHAKGIRSKVQQEVMAATALADFFINAPEEVMIAVLDYLSGRLLRDLREIEDQLNSLETLSKRAGRAAGLAARAADIAIGNGERQPESFRVAADHINTAIRELRFKAAYASEEDAKEFQESSFIGRALAEIDRAKEALPEGRTLQDRVGQVANLLTTAAAELRKVGRDAARYPRIVRGLAQSYGDAQFVAYLIRNLPENMTSGLQLASVVGVRSILLDVIQKLEAREDAMREFARTDHTNAKINRRATYERFRLEEIALRLAGVEGLLSGSLSDTYPEAMSKMVEVAEDPFFFGDGEALVQIEAHARLLTGSKQIRDDRFESIGRIAASLEGYARAFSEVVEGLIAEIKQRRPVDPSIQSVGLLIEQIVPRLSSDAPMMALATGTVAVRTARTMISEDSESEDGGEEEPVSPSRPPFSGGRRYYNRYGDGRARADLAARRESDAREQREAGRTIAESISEAVQRDRRVEQLKRERLKETQI
jgi:hypothetical protein